MYCIVLYIVASEYMILPCMARFLNDLSALSRSSWVRSPWRHPTFARIKVYKIWKLKKERRNSEESGIAQPAKSMGKPSEENHQLVSKVCKDWIVEGVSILESRNIHRQIPTTYRQMRTQTYRHTDNHTDRHTYIPLPCNAPASAETTTPHSSSSQQTLRSAFSCLFSWEYKLCVCYQNAFYWHMSVLGDPCARH